MIWAFSIHVESLTKANLLASRHYTKKVQIKWIQIDKSSSSIHIDKKHVVIIFNDHPFTLRYRQWLRRLPFWVYYVKFNVESQSQGSSFFSNISRIHRASAWYLFASNEYQKINKLSSPLKKWPNVQAYPSFLGRSRGGETVQEAHHFPTTFV